MRQRPVRHLQVGGAVRVKHPDPADVARITADHEPAQLAAAGDPRLERVAVVAHVVDDEAGPGQRPADHRQEVHQERGLAGHCRRHARRGHAIGPPPGRGAPEPAVQLAVVGGHRQGQPPLQLSHGQRGGGVAVVAAALARAGERGARQLVHRLHHRADDPLDDPAVVRLPGRPVAQLYPVLLTAAPQRFALELGRVVQVQLGRLTAHRPGGRHAEALQPGLLVRRHVRQAQPGRQRRWRLQRHHQARDAPAEYVDPGRHVRPADRQPVPLVDHDHVGHRVVDLHLLQHRGHRRRRAAGRPQRPRCVRPFPRRCLPDRIQPRDAPRERSPRGHPPPAAAAGPRQLPVHRRHRPFLPGQIPRPQQITDHRLDLIGQMPAATAPAGPPRDQVRDDTLAFPPAAQQQVHLPPRHPQLRRGRVRRLPPHHVQPGQPADHPRAADSQAPHLPGHRQQPALSKHHRLVSHPRTSPSRTGAWDRLTLVQTTPGQPDVPYFSALTRKPGGRPCKEPQTSTAAPGGGVGVTLDSRHLRTPNQSHTRTVLSLLVVSVLSSRHRRAGRKSARSLSSASRLSGIDCDPHVRELITVESYVATVADQGKHPGVVEHDVGLQVGHATCRRGGNNGAEQVAS